MEAFLTSTMLVALAEMGDKTQLLAILLAARLRRPVPIIAGILVATVANHFLAALVGHWAAGILGAGWFRITVALAFVAMAAWTLVPDKMDNERPVGRSGAGAFVTTVVAFFLLEMGDKTQIATIALGARFENLLAVTAGTTLGMMIANVPAVLLGDALIERIPLRGLRYAAAALFLAIGVWLLAEQMGFLPR